VGHIGHAQVIGTVGENMAMLYNWILAEVKGGED